MAARAEYGRALDSDPTYEKARANLGALKCRFGDLEGAKRELSVIKDTAALAAPTSTPSGRAASDDDERCCSSRCSSPGCGRPRRGQARPGGQPLDGDGPGLRRACNIEVTTDDVAVTFVRSHASVQDVTLKVTDALLGQTLNTPSTLDLAELRPRLDDLAGRGVAPDARRPAPDVPQRRARPAHLLRRASNPPRTCGATSTSPSRRVSTSPTAAPSSAPSTRKCRHEDTH